MHKLQKIVLIEDDHDIRVSFRQTLESCGHFVYTVANGWDALVLLEKIEPPQLIILDLSMPIMNGEEFLKLKEEDPKLADTPVLIVSCHQERLDILKRYPSIKKPLDLDAFMDKVASCLKPPVLSTPD